ncbi:hypothetical protein CRG98_009566 [Punica granatum]|uniref:Uncharacterized protein n=1 Tax=Punica granatum TaxID=22663 RepID=A0A2I0KP89_PUNGR|nr:hypothetical protein CRG98_009566 [Punica granatum]
MAIGCPTIIGLPLISHLGCTLVFLSRVIRQLGHLQDIPADADRSAYQLTWVEVSPSAIGRFTRVHEVRQMWETHLSQNLYFPKFPTDEERAFSATSSYVAWEERDRLRRELADIRAELTDQRELQRELAQTCACVESLNREIARLSATLDQARAKTRKVLTIGGASPVSHTLPIKNGRGKSTCCLRREYTTDASSFSTAHNECATTTYSCRRTTNTSRSSLGPSPTTNFNEHATTVGVRATTTWVRAATTDGAKSRVFELHPASRMRANCRPLFLGLANPCIRGRHSGRSRADKYPSACSSSDARAGNSPGRLLPTSVHYSSNCLTSAHDDFRAGSDYVSITSRVRAGSSYGLRCSSADGLPGIERPSSCSHY